MQNRNWQIKGGGHGHAHQTLQAAEFTAQTRGRNWNHNIHRQNVQSADEIPGGRQGLMCIAAQEGRVCSARLQALGAPAGLAIHEVRDWTSLMIFQLFSQGPPAHVHK